MCCCKINNESCPVYTPIKYDFWLRRHHWMSFIKFEHFEKNWSVVTTLFIVCLFAWWIYWCVLVIYCIPLDIFCLCMDNFGFALRNQFSKYFVFVFDCHIILFFKGCCHAGWLVGKPNPIQINCLGLLLGVGSNSTFPINK